MKLKEVEIGGRYHARVSGRVAVVRVTGMQDVAGYGRSRARTVITAVNETTGRQISMRSAQRLRPLPTTRHIGSVNKVEDLGEGTRSFPEPDLAYDLRLIDGPPMGMTVRFVYRRGDQILARTGDGQDYPVTGTGAYILCPVAKRQEAMK